MNYQNKKYTELLSESVKIQYENKKAEKDFDKDGKVETPEAEFKGSKDKAIKKAMAKNEGWAAVSECIDSDTLTVEDQEGKKEIPIIKRPISQLDASAVKGASEIAIDSKAKAKKDPDPKQMKSDDKKGTAAGTGK